MDFKKLLPHLVAIVTFFIVIFITFTPQFQGKVIRGGDAVSYSGAAKESKDYKEATGERQNWTGTTFSGMPTYQLNRITEGNYVPAVAKPLTLGLPRPAGAFMLGLIVCYLFYLLIGVNPWLSIAGAVGTVLATNNLVLFQTGHTTKVNVILYFPLIAAGIVYAYRKRVILGALVFALGMALAIAANHPQMLYYFGITVPLYAIGRFFYDWREGRLPHFFKASAALLIGLFLALGAGASNILPTQEYAPSSMRGGQVLETPIQDTGSGASTTGSGLDWNYAMAWSNGFKDMIATYAPLAAGGGSGELVENTTEVGQAFRRAGFQMPRKFTVPLYHGVLPFTEGPSYLGAVVWALFIFGLFAARRPLAIWLGGGTLLILLMSAGKNIEGFNRFLYDNLPLLNKFRTPNSSLSISVFMMLMLGIVGIHDWLGTLRENEDKARRQLLISGAIAGTLGAFIAFILPAFLDFNGPNDVPTMTRFVSGQVPVEPLIDALNDTRQSVYFSDAMRSFLFVGLTFGSLFLLFTKRISVVVASLIVAALVAFDFMGINTRYLSAEDWKTPSRVERTWTPSAADEQILKDPDPHYRVFNSTVKAFDDATTSYYHKSVGGYSAVKLRRYQDLIDGYLRSQNIPVFSMLNTKYFIVNGADEKPEVRLNSQAFGPAWLVNDIQTVNSNDAEFAALGTTPNLKTTAIVHDDFSANIAGLNPTGEGSIELTSYSPDVLTYAVNAQGGEQLAIFSEIWYGPDLGWNAYIDGQPAELFRANYILRALRIPAGRHTVELRFEPSSYSTGVLLSTICSILILLGIFGYAAYLYLNRKGIENTATPTEEMPQKSSKPRR